MSMSSTISISMNKEITNYYIKNINDIISLTVVSPIKFLQNKTIHNNKTTNLTQTGHNNNNTVITRYDLIKLAEKQDRRKKSKGSLI